MSHDERVTTDIWCFRARGTQYERETALALVWELHLDPMSDNFDPDETSARVLLAKWAAQVGMSPVDVHWFVSGDGTFETAPSTSDRGFLDTYTWPVNVRTGERLRWPELPVVDKLWRPGRADKGGFFQEATGWKPSPFQRSVDWQEIVGLAGLSL